VKEKQIDVHRNQLNCIAQIYAGKYEGKVLTPKEKDDYLASYSNAEIILALVDQQLRISEQENLTSYNPLLMFKAPTGLMDVRNNDPKYRAFDRKDYDAVAGGNDDIADTREVVPAVRYVLRRV
jgi:hypothetical protein